MQSKILYIFIGSFVGGVAFRSLVDLGHIFSYFVLGLAVVLFLYYLVDRKHTILFVSVAMLAMSFGMLRFDVSDKTNSGLYLKEYIGQHVVAEGVVVDEPDERDKNTRLVVVLDEIHDSKIPEATVKTLIIVDRYPTFMYGDRILIEGKLDVPSNFENDSGRTFDYISYLKKDNILYTMFYPEVSYISSNNGHPIKATLFALKNSVLDVLRQHLPDPHVSLLGGLLVGAKQSLGSELQEIFRKTGIIHIVVLSGYNVTIVARAIINFFGFLPTYAGQGLGALSIIFFAIMTGGSATVVRASIMALLVIAADATKRTYLITRALALAAFVMVLHNPKIVLFDPSFQLSFVATLGLIYVAPHIEKYFPFLTEKFGLRSVAAATIGTQLFVLPLLLYMTGELSLVALPVNLLILLIVPLTMFLGFLTGIVGFVSSTLAFPLALSTYALLAYSLQVVDFFAKFPFASVTITYFPVWFMLVIYIVYVVFLYRFNTRKTKVVI